MKWILSCSNINLIVTLNEVEVFHITFGFLGFIESPISSVYFVLVYCSIYACDLIVKAFLSLDTALRNLHYAWYDYDTTL